MRCQAKSKRSRRQCKSWAVKGKRVCRMHGAFAGIKTAEGRIRQIEAVTKHGHYSKEVILEKMLLRLLLKEAKTLLRQAG